MGLSDLAVCSLTLFPPRFVVSSQGRNGCPSSMMVFCAEGSHLWAPLPMGEAVEASGQQLAPADSGFDFV